MGSILRETGRQERNKGSRDQFWQPFWLQSWSLFDDVLSTARTARAALNAIFDYGRPKQVSFAVLFNRDNRHLPIQPNFVGVNLDVDHSLRVNVEFFEVFGEDRVMLGSM